MNPFSASISFPSGVTGECQLSHASQGQDVELNRSENREAKPDQGKAVLWTAEREAPEEPGDGANQGAKRAVCAGRRRGVRRAT